jgi:hypothetical protein
MRTHLDTHSWIEYSEVHLTGLSHVVTTTESKSVSLGVGSKPANNIFTVIDHWRSTLTRPGHCAKTSLLCDYLYAHPET